jgi:hypothetical protein
MLCSVKHGKLTICIVGKFLTAPRAAASQLNLIEYIWREALLLFDTRCMLSFAATMSLEIQAGVCNKCI